MTFIMEKDAEKHAIHIINDNTKTCRGQIKFILKNLWNTWLPYSIIFFMYIIWLQSMVEDERTIIDITISHGFS